MLSRYECRLIHKTKGTRWVEIYSKPFEYNNSPAIHAVFIDVTERKQAEEALRESEAKYRSLVETTSDWIWEVDTDGVYTYANPKVEEILGYKPEEVIGKTPFDFMPSAEAARVSDVFHNIVPMQKSIDSIENINLHKDGHPVVLQTSGIPRFNEKGKLLGYRGIDRDVSEKKQVEEKLRESELKHKTLIQNIPGMVYRAYPD